MQINEITRIPISNFPCKELTETYVKISNIGKGTFGYVKILVTFCEVLFLLQYLSFANQLIFNREVYKAHKIGDPT